MANIEKSYPEQVSGISGKIRLRNLATVLSTLQYHLSSSHYIRTPCKTFVSFVFDS